MRDGLLRVRKFFLPSQVIRDSVRFLRRGGKEGFEAFVLWSGRLTDDHTLRFSRAIVPAQRAMVTKNGLLVAVDGKALFEVNKNVHECHEVLAAQVHTHPSDAYHSTTDDTYPLVTLLGALSVVIPNFAMDAPQDFESWAWYRLSRRAKWVPAGKETEVEFE